MHQTSEHGANLVKQAAGCLYLRRLGWTKYTIRVSYLSKIVLFLTLLRWKTPIHELVPVYSRQRSMKIYEEDDDGNEWRRHLKKTKVNNEEFQLRKHSHWILIISPQKQRFQLKRVCQTDVYANNLKRAYLSRVARAPLRIIIIIIVIIIKVFAFLYFNH